MTPTPPRSFHRLLVFALVWLPLGASGQSTGSPPADEPGWGSTWTAPVTEQQRESREFAKQYQAARKARNEPAALGICNRALQKQPDQVSWYVLRADTFGRLKQFDRAMTDLDHVQAVAQRNRIPALSAAAFVVRARIHQEAGDYPAAATDLEGALKADTRNALALNNLAWLRSTAPDATVRDGREGIRLAQKAATLQRNRTWVVTDTLAAAYAEAGDYPRAVDSEQRALAAAPKEIPDPDKARDFQKKAAERLHLFEQHQPYHAPPDPH